MHMTESFAFRCWSCAGHQSMKLGDRRPVASGCTISECPPSCLDELPREQPFGTPHVRRASADRELRGSPILLLDRCEFSEGRRITDNRHEKARGIVGTAAERIALDYLVHLVWRQHYHAGRNTDLARESLLDPHGSVGGSGPRCENDVAAVQKRAHVPVAETFDERAQVAHSDSLRAPDVDAANQRDVDFLRFHGRARTIKAVSNQHLRSGKVRTVSTYCQTRRA